MTERGRHFMERLFSFPPLAHHPDCACYDAHVLRCGPLALCLGCTCMAAGALATTTLLAWAQSCGPGVAAGWPATITGVACGCVLFMPTLFQPFCQRKLFKIIARFMLGAAVVVLGAAGLLLPPVDVAGIGFRAAFTCIFWLVFKATLRQRARFTPDPCARCKPRTYPFCEGNRHRVAATLAEFRRCAEPADAEFVMFATALAGDTPSDVTVEVDMLHVIGSPETRGCHRT